MTTGNFDDPPAPSPAPIPPRRFRMPAEYYAAPLSEVRPIFPPWVAYGCGSLAGVFLVFLFAGGAWLASGGMSTAMDLILGQTLGEVRGMYAKDVTEADKKAVDDEFSALRKGLREETVSVTRLQPVLRAVQGVISDKTVTHEEVEKLRTAVRAAQTPAAK
ncbi:MAG TPA: hypothetical protein VF698_18055 [Thermoanaerobaculia bacterium]|jgi:hypothetical protein